LLLAQEENGMHSIAMIVESIKLVIIEDDFKIEQSLLKLGGICVKILDVALLLLQENLG